MHGVDEESIVETWGMWIGYLRESLLGASAFKLSFLSQLRYFDGANGIVYVRLYLINYARWMCIMTRNFARRRKKCT